MAGIELRDVVINKDAPAAYCRSCGTEIWWGKTATGKRCPFDIVDGKHTAISHFSTCPDAHRWSKR
jgi:predicted RNA-binding Zn-ribbon protein involved in translation (DUF1610 family)